MMHESGRSIKENAECHSGKNYSKAQSQGSYSLIKKNAENHGTEGQGQPYKGIHNNNLLSCCWLHLACGFHFMPFA